MGKHPKASRDKPKYKHDILLKRQVEHIRIPGRGSWSRLVRSCLCVVAKGREDEGVGGLAIVNDRRADLSDGHGLVSK